MADVTTPELREMLRVKYSGGSAWAIFEEVHDVTGYGHSRACDAIAMSLWPSKGLELHGFEIKVSRADWLNELRNPDKSETFRKFCDRWWLVVSSRNIVKDDLPPGWGLLWPRGAKLVVSRGAPKLEPKPIERDFLAAILRRAYECSVDKDARDDAYQKGREAGERWAKEEAVMQAGHTEDLKESIKAFEQLSGLEINKYNGPKLGEAVRALLGLRMLSSPLKRLDRLREDVSIRANELEDVLAKLTTAAEAAGILSVRTDKQ